MPVYTSHSYARWPLRDTKEPILPHRNRLSRQRQSRSEERCQPVSAVHSLWFCGLFFAARYVCADSFALSGSGREVRQRRVHLVPPFSLSMTSAGWSRCLAAQTARIQTPMIKSAVGISVRIDQSERSLIICRPLWMNGTERKTLWRPLS